MRIRVTSLAFVASIAVVASCSSDDSKPGATVQVTPGASVTVSPKQVELPPMGDGDVKITSTDGALVLSVIGDTVRMQLSDSLRQSVSKQVDSSTANSGAIGSMIAKTVASAVNTAMGFVVRTHVDNIKNLRYENGHLKFEINGTNTNVKSEGGDNEKSGFNQADATRFIDAVKARQKAI